MATAAAARSSRRCPAATITAAATLNGSGTAATLAVVSTTAARLRSERGRDRQSGDSRR
jgi:hypothetical protein